MIETGIVFQFILTILFMAVAAVIGYFMARQRYRNENDARVTLLASETSKWRRRAAVAEDRAKAAESALTRERRRARR